MSDENKPQTARPTDAGCSCADRLCHVVKEFCGDLKFCDPSYLPLFEAIEAYESEQSHRSLPVTADWLREIGIAQSKDDELK